MDENMIPAQLDDYKTVWAMGLRRQEHHGDTRSAGQGWAAAVLTDGKVLEGGGGARRGG